MHQEVQCQVSFLTFTYDLAYVNRAIVKWLYFIILKNNK